MSDEPTPEGVHYAPSIELLSQKNRNVVPQALRSGRIPPQALEMEQAVLGAVILVKSGMDKVAHFLKAEMFYKEGHKLIYESLLDMHAADHPIDMLEVKNHLSGRGMLEAAGGVFYLTELMSKVASDDHVEYHARLIQEKWIKRSMIRICDELINDCYDETSDTFWIHSKAIKDMEDLEPKSESLVNGMELVAQVAVDVEAAMNGKSPSLRLGFRDMDGEYAFDFGEYVVVAGDSGTGKTTFAMQFVKRMRKMYPSTPIIFNARDMDAKKVVARDLASEMGMSQMRFRTGNGIETRHFGQMNDLSHNYNGIWFCHEFSTAGLRAFARRIKKKLGLPPDSGIVIVNDYLQLGDGDGSSREQQVANISLDDKKIAIKQRALMIDLSQVNETAGKSRPNHKSIRESRAPYHHADWVIFLYSPSRNDQERYEDGTPTANIIEAIMDKVRCGRPGQIIRLWMTEHGKITDMPRWDDNLPSDGLPDPRRIKPKVFSEPSHSEEQPGGEDYSIGTPNNYHKPF